MTELIKDYALIALIITGIFYSGFPSEIESMISKRLKLGTFRIPKPFGCQLCSTFWACLIWGLIFGPVNLYMVLASLVAGLSTTVIENAYMLVFDTLNTWIVKLNNFINGNT